MGEKKSWDLLCILKRQVSGDEDIRSWEMQIFLRSRQYPVLETNKDFEDSSIPSFKLL